MEFEQLVRQRRSQRSYDSDRLPSPALIKHVLEIARCAPSAANRQPWRILVIQSPEKLNLVHAAYPRDWFMAAPCVIVVIGQRSKAWTRTYDGYNSLETDLAILMDHLTLAAWDSGLGSCWIGNFEPAVLRESLALTPDEEVFAMTPLGYAPTGAPPNRPAPRAELAEIVIFL